MPDSSCRGWALTRLAKQCERLEAGVQVLVAVAEANGFGGQSKPEASAGGRGVDAPAREFGKSFFGRKAVQRIPVEKLHAFLTACKLLEEQLSAACIGLPGDPPRRV